MDRRKFIRSCLYTAVGAPIAVTFLQSCEGIYYATTARKSRELIVAKTEFRKVKKNKTLHRKFVLVKADELAFPICLHKRSEDEYMAVLLECTHRGCELNVGGGIYSCPCHGSEFTLQGKVIEGPAIRDLKTFTTHTDHENIYINLS